MKTMADNEKKIEEREDVKEEEATTTSEENKSEENKVEEKSELDILKEKNEELTQQVAILKNEYAKAYADTENTRKRLTKEFEQLSKYKIQSFALAVLPVLDDCERALAHETKDETYRKGVEMMYSKLKAALEAEGVTEIEALDKPFDGNWHQALMSEHVEGKEPGIVIEVLQKGYKLKDRILRAAMVKVSE